MKRNVDAARAIQTIAMKEGATVEEVRKQIKLAMLAGLCKQDLVIQARWKKVSCEGEVPTPEELITYIATHVDAGIDPFT